LKDGKKQAKDRSYPAFQGGVKKPFFIPTALAVNTGLITSKPEIKIKRSKKGN